MKTIKLIIPLVLLAVITWSCSLVSSDSKKEVNVTFKTTQDSYDLGDTVTAILKNNSSRSVICGSSFQVEQKKHGKWEAVPFRSSVGFTLEAIELPTGKKITYRFALADSSQLFPPHSFPEGLYRVTTDIGSVGPQRNDYVLKTQPFHVNANVQR
jgi:hypothetical protein